MTSPLSRTRQLVSFCRPGFENEMRMEILTLLGPHVTDLRVHADEGYALAQALFGRPEVSRAIDTRSLDTEESWTGPTEGLVWTTGLLWGRIVHFAAGSLDRVRPLRAAMEQEFAQLGVEANLRDLRKLRVQAPPGTRVPGLQRFCGQFAKAFLRADSGASLSGKGSWDADIVFLDYETAVLSLIPSHEAESSRSRLRGRVARLPGAPSRSAQKLQEAFRFFQFSAESVARESRWAVDLGACPGGWTKVLTNCGYRVFSVDHGALAQDLLSHGQVTHARQDAFHFRPPHPVQIVVCDVVEKPRMIIELMGKWIRERQARVCVFNLKLPMKRKSAEVWSGLTCLAEILREESANFRLDAHHLYHDRQEVTVWVEVESWG